MTDHRSEILRESREWIGTPFHHQASVKGIGTDCLGLIRGIWRACYGDEPEPVPPYSPDWAEARNEETLLHAARRWLEEADKKDAAPGDVLLFRLRPNAPVRHCGVLTQSDHFIHAWSGYAVAEVPFDSAWRRRLSHVFCFPSAMPDHV